MYVCILQVIWRLYVQQEKESYDLMTFIYGGRGVGVYGGKKGS